LMRIFLLQTDETDLQLTTPAPRICSYLQHPSICSYLH
jgi:hypothetical protein